MSTGAAHLAGGNSLCIGSVHTSSGGREGAVIRRRGRPERPQTLDGIFVHHVWQHVGDVVRQETGQRQRPQTTEEAEQVPIRSIKVRWGGRGGGAPRTVQGLDSKTCEKHDSCSRLRYRRWYLTRNRSRIPSSRFTKPWFKPHTRGKYQHPCHASALTCCSRVKCITII